MILLSSYYQAVDFVTYYLQFISVDDDIFDYSYLCMYRHRKNTVVNLC